MKVCVIGRKVALHLEKGHSVGFPKVFLFAAIDRHREVLRDPKPREREAYVSCGDQIYGISKFGRVRRDVDDRDSHCGQGIAIFSHLPTDGVICAVAGERQHDLARHGGYRRPRRSARDGPGHSLRASTTWST